MYNSYVQIIRGGNTIMYTLKKDLEKYKEVLKVDLRIRYRIVK